MKIKVSKNNHPGVARSVCFAAGKNLQLVVDRIHQAMEEIHDNDVDGFHRKVSNAQGVLYWYISEPRAKTIRKRLSAIEKSVAKTEADGAIPSKAVRSEIGRKLSGMVQSAVDLADVYQRKHCDGRGTRERLRKWTRSP